MKTVLPETKQAQLLAFMRAGNWPAALSLASKFTRLGEHEVAVKRGHAARVNPDFYRQIKQDPQSLVKAGIAALKARYKA